MIFTPYAGADGMVLHINKKSWGSQWETETLSLVIVSFLTGVGEDMKHT